MLTVVCIWVGTTVFVSKFVAYCISNYHINHRPSGHVMLHCPLTRLDQQSYISTQISQNYLCVLQVLSVKDTVRFGCLGRICFCGYPVADFFFTSTIVCLGREDFLREQEIDKTRLRVPLRVKVFDAGNGIPFYIIDIVQGIVFIQSLSF